MVLDLALNVRDDSVAFARPNCERTITRLPGEVAEPMALEPMGRAGLEFRHHGCQRGRSGEGEEGVDMILHASDSNAWTAQPTERARHVRVKVFTQFLRQHGCPMFGGEHDVDGQIGKRLRHLTRIRDWGSIARFDFVCRPCRAHGILVAFPGLAAWAVGSSARWASGGASIVRLALTRSSRHARTLTSDWGQ